MTTLASDTAGDLLNSGSFGVVSEDRKYYTLMQPPNTSSIHLASFDLSTSAYTKKIVPLPTTVAEGSIVDGFLCGTDEDESGVYFARIDPATGKSTVKTPLGHNFTYSSGATAVDPETKTMWFMAAHSHGGNNFTLFAFDTDSGAIKSATHLHPTPDTQGPAGLVWHPRSARLLAFMPPVDGSWQMVAIDPSSGEVSPTTGLEGMSLHGREAGAEFLVEDSDGKAVLHAGFFVSMGAPCRMLALDVDCALAAKPGVNCEHSNACPPSFNAVDATVAANRHAEQLALARGRDKGGADGPRR